MKKLFCSIMLILSVACTAIQLNWCAQEAIAHHAAIAVFHGLMTFVWFVAALDAAGGAVPSFRTWLRARWRAAKDVLSEYRLYREIGYALAFALPVLALPLFAVISVLLFVFRPAYWSFDYVRSEWISVRVVRRNVERSFRIRNEAFSKAKAATGDVLPKAATSA